MTSERDSRLTTRSYNSHASFRYSTDMRTFHLALIKPSHYDDDGYVIQWLRSSMPSNSLGTLHGIAADCAERRVLGDDVDIQLSTCDESNIRIRVKRIARRIRRQADVGLVALVGVQSNQFPRAVDLARQFLCEGMQVCIGGFHVSGSIAMLPELAPELQDAIDMGVSLFAGEAEGRLELVLADAMRGELKPIYNFIDELPGMESVPTPILSARTVRRTAGGQASFDAGRGCPFSCSFCTIINVQGKKSRYRSADDIERIIRANSANGISRYFITDDNFARNSNWEAIFDRLAELKERDRLHIRLVIQVDTACHKIPNFIAKAKRAGVRRVFIGLENINPDSLKGAQKGHNRITDYRTMLQEWRAIGVVTTAGYILGFPGDTKESILRDVRLIKRELPIDLLEFNILTPLPGSVDHQQLVKAGVPLDPDLNKYDLDHVTMEHDSMTTKEWKEACREAWVEYYSRDHIETLMRRAQATGVNVGKILAGSVLFYGSIVYEGINPLESGVVRMKFRKDRRPGFPIESRLPFYAKYIAHFLYTCWKGGTLYLSFVPHRRRLRNDPGAMEYTDQSLEKVTESELETLELFTVTPAARAAAGRAAKMATKSLQS